MSTHATQSGDLAVFGFTKDLEGFLKQHLPARLGIRPRTIDFGAAGHFFFYTSSGDVAESGEAVALKLGYVRSLTRSPLSTQQLLDQKIAKSDSIDNSAFRGNALVACFSKIKPCFSVYQTIMALPQLYYARLGEGILCATNLRRLLALLPRPQLNEDVIPMHFLFNFVPGPLTYFRGVWRLFPGQMLKWNDGDLSVALVRDLRLSADSITFDRLDSTSLEAFHQSLGEVMAAYLGEMRSASERPGTLLSGGVDSSVVQCLVNEQLHPAERPVSFSFAMRAPSFEREIEYAKHASEIFRTQHTFVDILPEDYPDLLVRTIEMLGQPNLYSEGSPCVLGLAEFLASNAPDVHCFFAGQGADALHGLSAVRQVALFETASRIPGSRLAFQLMATVLKRGVGKSYYVLEEAANMLAAVNSSAPQRSLTIYDPTNYVAVSPKKFEMARRCFGDRTLLRVLDYRRSLEAEYLNSASMTEKIQVIDLLTAGYEPAVIGGQLFSANHKKQIQFYLDEEVIGMTLAFKPGVRFLKGFSTTKPLLKQILTRKSSAALSKKTKGGTTFSVDLSHWMTGGPLHDMVQAMELPGFVSGADFDALLKDPDNSFLWNLLKYDIFQKHVLRSRNHGDGY